MNNTKLEEKIHDRLAMMPVIAIIRGVTPDEVVDIATAIYNAGIHIIEVPLNSPKPFKSIALLNQALGDHCVVGCGTLVNKSDVEKVAAAGGQIAVTPNTDPKIIRKCIKQGMVPAPGWATATDAHAAYKAGARILKLFPASSYDINHAKSVRATMPADIKILAVGGVGAANAEQWLAAGIDGFGIGSEIYKSGDSADEVSVKAMRIVTAVSAARMAVSHHK